MARGESSGDALCHTATMGKIGPKLKEEIVNEQTYKLTNLLTNKLTNKLTIPSPIYCGDTTSCMCSYTEHLYPPLLWI